MSRSLKEYASMVKKLTLDELIGQLMCVNISLKEDPQLFEEYCKVRKPGSIFLNGHTGSSIKTFTEIANRYSPIPVIVASDIEHGPGMELPGERMLPNCMAWGACNDAQLVKQAGEDTAKICRKNGIHWTFAPVVDLNINSNNPESNIRSISDDPARVIAMAGAHMEGMQEKGYMMTTCKHFPGQGMDDRNSHFVTVDNPLSKRKWMSTYGAVYKEMIRRGTPAIMTGHITLPAFQPQDEGPLGPLPATLSKALTTDLLKGKLGFKGCIVSDAMGMIGASSHYPIDEMIVRFFNAGGDMYLFPRGIDYDFLKKAVEDGEVSMERLQDAAMRVMYLKDRARLFEDEEKVLAEIEDNVPIGETAQKIADKSICVVRDQNGIIPTKLPKGSKVLLVNAMEDFFHKPPKGNEFAPLKQAFMDAGHQVTELYIASYKQIKEERDNYDLILVNLKFSSRDTHGGSLRIGWDNIDAFWHTYVFQHPKAILTSFGDPYKIREFPYVKTYINAFSYTEDSQRAVAKVILGQIPAQGKSPVDFPPYFNRED